MQAKNITIKERNIKNQVTDTTESELEAGQGKKLDDKLDEAPEEWGGRDGLEPTRYGDWEKNGRCIDF